MPETEAQRLGRLETSLGVSFSDVGLLRLALVHSSYVNENPDAFGESNERLEYLGDAVIGAVVAQELYESHPDWSEGDLTQARAAVVKGETLAVVGERLELGRHLRMGRGEEAGGGRERPTNLAAATEAVVGAVLLDQGHEGARAVVRRLLAVELSSAGDRGAAKHPKSALQEVVQAQGMVAPTYHIVEVSGEDHARRFTAEVTVGGRVVARGAGSRKSQAEQEAAAAALEALGDEPGADG